jgi:hypothetical protein
MHRLFSRSAYQVIPTSEGSIELVFLSTDHAELERQWSLGLSVHIVSARVKAGSLI